VLLTVLTLLTGCRPSGPTGPAPATPEASAGQWRDELFTYAMENLNRLEEFAPGEMLQQIVERLNQWASHQAPPVDWRLDPMLQKLPETLAAFGDVEELERPDFTLADGEYLQEAVWLRDAAAWARGNELDELTRATRLFDWTVRNIALEPPLISNGKPVDRVPVVPWQTLLAGRGTAIDRVWVFLLLARQQGLEAAMLGVSASDDAKRLQPWTVGVLIGTEIYLFDPWLGLPIPAPGPIPRGPAGQLQPRPARLSDVIADPKLLRRLDADPQHPYRIRTEQLKRVVAMLEGSPAALSRRMRLIESRLAGKQKLVLTATPTRSVLQWRKARHLTDTGLWLFPLETQWRIDRHPEEVGRFRAWLLDPFQVNPTAGLWKGRLLHLRGALVGEDSATACYQTARPSNANLQQAGMALAEQYFKRGLQANPSQSTDKAKQEAADRAQTQTMLIFRGKYDASYWLGLIAYERGNWASAIDYFQRRTLGAVPDGLWSAGARYSLARTYEASGQRVLAQKQYAEGAKLDADSGQAVRGRWLRATDTKPGGK
jgi:tetratricopeptide (TPR) repeat protein